MEELGIGIVIVVFFGHLLIVAIFTLLSWCKHIIIKNIAHYCLIPFLGFLLINNFLMIYNYYPKSSSADGQFQLLLLGTILCIIMFVISLITWFIKRYVISNILVIILEIITFIIYWKHYLTINLS